MNPDSEQLLLIGAVAAVGVLHTMVPDHWAPIALMARQRHWSKTETIRAALQAGTGHVLSTLLIGLVVWIAGVAVAQRFGHYVDAAASVALIAFGGWIAAGAWRELHTHDDDHDRQHHHNDHHDDQDHHNHKASSRTALLLILGSSPMIEGLPAFFAAGKYGVGLIAVMSAVFALCTIATYVLLCVLSAEGLRHMKFGSFERYGELLSGGFIALIGLIFWIWPAL